MDEYDDNETIEGIEIGELMDINTSQSTYGSTLVGGSTKGLDDPQTNAYAKGYIPKKFIVHKERKVMLLPISYANDDMNHEATLFQSV
ncbi:hypothetical protein LIER_30528 [Lithospermum erythrorhizon]|uniref:Uncharacterized protein n=1 Tax=Lithospermum erythrorhizon TaxID=34254 RepID=A0AAV3RR30_LITER